MAKCWNWLENGQWSTVISSTVDCIVIYKCILQMIKVCSMIVIGYLSKGVFYIFTASTYSNLSNLSVPDVRGMVKTLVCGMKTITWGVKACKTPANGEYNPTLCLAWLLQVLYIFESYVCCWFKRLIHTCVQHICTYIHM